MQTSTTRQQVRHVLLITLILNFSVAVGKILLGLLTGALAITADGFHSLIDGSSNIVALVANRIADRPPDDEHPYGHRRFETIAALAIGGFLLLTAWEIISSALARLGGSGEAPEITPLAFAVMLGTLAVNLFVTRYESREGHRLNSELLIADAAHTSTDVYITLSVIISMVAVAFLGWFWIDTAAALVIVVLILRAAWQVLRQTGSILVDTAPYSPEQLKAIIQEVPAVQDVIRTRSRGSTDSVHIDVDVQVAPEMTTEQSANIAQAIRDHLNTSLPGIEEVEVHFVPQQSDERDYALTARACADALGLSTHEVFVNHLAGKDNNKVLELHVEVPPGQTLDEAHLQVSQLEQSIQQKLSDVSEVITHIEPAMDSALPRPDAKARNAALEVRDRALALLRHHYPAIDWHDLRALPTPNGFTLTLHATLPPHITIETAHHIAEEAEVRLRTDLPEINRVTIHTEPPERAG